ncbi:MAG: 23S rRNA (adenine(1618)-N(6))-methyltransferase RlmF [Oligoflexia bacterium]|nr:23S rRNA (adenine(1618)-N(6))-methyltransferase RlmF [Oligoflexia bacterium]
MKNRPTLHPRNRHQGRYDFARLTEALPELSSFVIETPYGDPSIDFANPASVKALNRAILKQFYNIEHWDVPEGYLCPPIPGRADYVHYAADLIAEFNDGKIPTGPGVRILDIGVGANCVYPIIGQSEYGWSFVGADVDERALASAKLIIDENPGLKGRIELRHQKASSQIFRGILNPGEKFDLSVCNPPFHSSLEEAQEGSRRKWKNLGKKPAQGIGKIKPPLKNFGGQASELWCPGGELEFVRRMITESAEFSTQCVWFSTLVSKVDNLQSIYRELRKAGVTDYREQMMSQGQKISRIVAWTFSIL